MSTIYDPTLNIMSSLATLFSTDNNQQVPKTETPVQQGQQPDKFLKDQAVLSTIGSDASSWGRSDWRRWRKQQGLSKQEMRNYRAHALMGQAAPRDVSRSELKTMEATRRAYGTPYIQQVAESKKTINGLTNALNNITNWSGTVNTDPIEIEEEVIEEEPLPGQAPAPAVTPVSPITYDWGKTVNAYWQGQNEKVLKALPEEQLRQFDANKDNKLDPNELMAWQQSIGAGNDLKFGSGTIGAASAKYGNSFKASQFNGYTNPAKAKNPKKVDNGNPATGFKPIGDSDDHYLNFVNSKDNFWSDNGWEEGFNMAYTRTTGSGKYYGDDYNKAKQNFEQNYLKKYYTETGDWFGDSWVKK